MTDADVESSSETYARRFAGAVGRWFLAVQAARTLRLLGGLPAGAQVLDVGGGHAQLVEPLVQAGYTLTVIGSSPGCGARLEPWTRTGRCEFIVGDLLALPWEDGAYDAVISFRLMAHVETWPCLIAELCRVARRMVVVDYPSRRSVNVVADRLFAIKRRIEGDPRPFRVFAHAEIIEAFEAAGFAVTARSPQFFWPMALHRAHRSAVVGRALEAPARWLGATAAMGSPIISRAERRCARRN